MTAEIVEIEHTTARIKDRLRGAVTMMSSGVFVIVLS